MKESHGSKGGRTWPGATWPGRALPGGVVQPLRLKGKGRGEINTGLKSTLRRAGEGFPTTRRQPRASRVAAKARPSPGLRQAKNKSASRPRPLSNQPLFTQREINPPGNQNHTAGAKNSSPERCFFSPGDLKAAPTAPATRPRRVAMPLRSSARKRLGKTTREW